MQAARIQYLTTGTLLDYPLNLDYYSHYWGLRLLSRLPHSSISTLPRYSSPILSGRVFGWLRGCSVRLVSTIAHAMFRNPA